MSDGTLSLMFGAQYGVHLPNLTGLMLVLDRYVSLWLTDADGRQIPCLGYRLGSRWLIHPRRFDELRLNLLPPFPVMRAELGRWADDGGKV